MVISLEASDFTSPFKDFNSPIIASILPPSVSSSCCEALWFIAPVWSSASRVLCSAVLISGTACWRRTLRGSWAFSSCSRAAEAKACHSGCQKSGCVNSGNPGKRGCKTARSWSSTTRRCLRRRTKLCPAKSSASRPPSFQHFLSILHLKRSSQPSNQGQICNCRDAGGKSAARRR